MCAPEALTSVPRATRPVLQLPAPLEIVDPATGRVLLAVGEDEGGTYLCLFGRSNCPAVELRVGPAGGRVTVSNGDGFECASLLAGADGGTVQARQATRADGYAEATLYADSGAADLTLAVNGHATSVHVRE